jgi:hypothetical protein
MRTTWMILVLMLVIGAGMYFFFTYKKDAPAEYDTITITKTADSIVKRIKVYVADNPTEVYYADSAWFMPDSTPLKKVVDASTLDYMNKHYHSATLYITYNDQAFYDLEINKPDSQQAYKVSLQLQSRNDTLYITGLLDKKEGDIVSFQGPLMPVYKQFAITYNNKLPPPPPDSTTTDSLEVKGPLPNKTITVYRN